MTFEESDLKGPGGTRLRRYSWRPDGKPWGGVVMLHGLGDYLMRYESVARFLVEQGLACEGVDLPGHGHSSGQRGHVDSWESLMALVDDSFARLREEIGGPETEYGLFAHSMGGYVALDYLGKRAGSVRFAWLSSPLIRPSHERPEWLLHLAETLGRVVPRVPYNPWVQNQEGQSRPPGQKGKNSDPLIHRYTTLGFGRQLVMQEQAVRKAARELPEDFRLLVTHGTEDDVCPYDLSRELFEEVQSPRKQFLTLEGERHEPLHGERKDEVFAAAAAWIGEFAQPMA